MYSWILPNLYIFLNGNVLFTVSQRDVFGPTFHDGLRPPVIQSSRSCGEVVAIPIQIIARRSQQLHAPWKRSQLRKLHHVFE